MHVSHAGKKVQSSASSDSSQLPRWPYTVDMPSLSEPSPRSPTASTKRLREHTASSPRPLQFLTWPLPFPLRLLRPCWVCLPCFLWSLPWILPSIFLLFLWLPQPASKRRSSKLALAAEYKRSQHDMRQHHPGGKAPKCNFPGSLAHDFTRLDWTHAPKRYQVLKISQVTAMSGSGKDLWNNGPGTFIVLSILVHGWQISATKYAASTDKSVSLLHKREKQFLS